MFSKLLAGSMVALNVGKTLAAVSWAGVNIAGFDFGCETSGTCDVAGVYPPKDGAAQMTHFTQQDNMNAYRLPVGWQYLVNNILGGDLHPANFATYDGLVQACLATGSYCIVDIHNYARWNGAIIGQGGPQDGDFTSLWSQLAMKYAQEPKVVMGLMNEPHDLDIDRWAQTVQAAVTAIRKAGAASHYILLPGNGYTNAGEFATGSAPALSKVVNLDGSTTNLIFDVHKYLDSDGSGTHTNCIDDGIDIAFAPLANYLRETNRRAILSEVGGGSNDPSCLTNICKSLAYLDNNSDVYQGYIGWSAGAFDSNYALSLTPSGNAASGYTDKPLLSNCFAPKSGKRNSPSSSPFSASYQPAGNGKVLSSNPPAGDGKDLPVPTPSVGSSKLPYPNPVEDPKPTTISLAHGATYTPTTLSRAVKPPTTTARVVPEDSEEDDECEAEL